MNFRLPGVMWGPIILAIYEVAQQFTPEAIDGLPLWAGVLVTVILAVGKYLQEAGYVDETVYQEREDGRVELDRTRGIGERTLLG